MDINKSKVNTECKVDIDFILRWCLVQFSWVIRVSLELCCVTWEQCSCWITMLKTPLITLFHLWQQPLPVQLPILSFHLFSLVTLLSCVTLCNFFPRLKPWQILESLNAYVLTDFCLIIEATPDLVTWHIVLDPWSWDFLIALVMETSFLFDLQTQIFCND